MKRLLCSSLAALFISGSVFAADPNPAQPVPERLDIRGAIMFALDNNFAIRQARERIRQQEGVVVEVKGRRIPNAALIGQYSKLDRDRIQGAGDDDDWIINLEVRQSLYAGGALSAGSSAQKQLLEAALYDLTGVINAELLGVRQKFYGVLLAQERIKVQEESLKLLEEEYRTAKNRYDAGVGSQFDLLRAEVAVSNGRPPLIRAKNAFRIAVEELRQSLGFTSNTPENVRKIPEFIGTLESARIEYVLQDVLTAARANRPELKRLQRIADAGEYSVAAARSGYKPSLDLVAGYAVKKSALSTSLGDTIDGWALSLQSRWAIFDGRQTSGRVIQAKSLLNQSKTRLTEAQLAIDVEVRRAYSQYQEATEILTSSGKVVDQAMEALRLARARFEVGAATQLDVLQVQVALTEARTNQVQAQHDYSIVLASLRKAMGMTDEIIAVR